MIRGISPVIVSIILILVLCGCWDVKYLDQLTVVMAIGMDEDPDKPGHVVVTLQVVVPSQVSDSQNGGGAGSIPVTTYTGKGKTLIDTVRSMNSQTSRRLFFSHNQVLIIGEKLARKGIGTMFDLIDRDTEIRTDFEILVAKNGTAADILTTLTTMEKIPVKQMYEMVRTYNKMQGVTYPVKALDFIRSLDSDKQQPAAGSIELIGDAEEAQKKDNIEQIKPANYLKLGGMAIFKDGKLVGFLNEQDSLGLTIIKKKMNRSQIDIPLDGEDVVSLGVLRSKTKVKANIYRNKPVVVIEIEEKAHIFEVKSSKVRVQDTQTIAWLEKKAEKQLEDQVAESAHTLQRRLNSDVMGYGGYIYQASPKYWREHSKEWSNIYPEINTVVKAKVDILATGIRNITDCP